MTNLNSISSKYYFNEHYPHHLFSNNPIVGSFRINLLINTIYDKNGYVKQVCLLEYKYYVHINKQWIAQPTTGENYITIPYSINFRDITNLLEMPIGEKNTITRHYINNYYKNKIGIEPTNLAIEGCFLIITFNDFSKHLYSQIIDQHSSL